MEQLAHRPGSRRTVQVGEQGPQIGDGAFVVIGGPCAVESRDGFVRIAHGVAAAGGGMLRGGAFKPRTSPHSFQGLGAEGLEILAHAREATGLPVVTEVLDPRDVERVAAIADVIQIGARNMSNGALLREVGRAGRPVLLKRGFGATIAELLDASEYILAEGNEDVLLVERGIRTFETSTRFTLDISAVPVLRAHTHLPVLVDPSHPAGAHEYVPALSRAAAAAGADGVMIEVHDEPHNALSDGNQAIPLEQFAALIAGLDPVVEAVGMRRSVPLALATPTPV